MPSRCCQNEPNIQLPNAQLLPLSFFFILVACKRMVVTLQSQDNQLPSNVIPLYQSFTPMLHVMSLLPYVLTWIKYLCKQQLQMCSCFLSPMWTSRCLETMLYSGKMADTAVCAYSQFLLQTCHSEAVMRSRCCQTEPIIHLPKEHLLPLSYLFYPCDMQTNAGHI